jgi:hypothetical protein
MLIGPPHTIGGMPSDAHRDIARVGVNDRFDRCSSPQGESRCWFAGNLSPAKRLAKAAASSGLAKQNTTTSLSSWRRKRVSGAADRTPAAQNITSRFITSHAMRPFAREITAGDFAFAAGHRPRVRLAEPNPAPCFSDHVCSFGVPA